MGKIQKRRVAAPTPPKSSGALLTDLRWMILTARSHTAQSVNAALVMLYWGIGERIRREILKEKRAQYGENIVTQLAARLTHEFGGGFSRRNLFNMIRMAEIFPDARIVQTLSAQLGWSHFLEIIYLKDPLQREFYAEMCRIERWSVRTLRQKTDSMLYQRTGLSRKPSELAKVELEALRDGDRLSPDLVFRDPYFLDFLGLKDTYSERDLEEAILREIEKFLLELGTDFSFVARQKRMSVGATDYYLDLLFYHRRLRSLVAIELKLGKFQPTDIGQMELYLRWLEKYEQRPGENPPFGVILCGNKDHEQVAVLKLDAKGIHVAEYLTEMPPKRLIKQRLHDAIQLAREQVSRDGAESSKK